MIFQSTVLNLIFNYSSIPDSILHSRHSISRSPNDLFIKYQLVEISHIKNQGGSNRGGGRRACVPEKHTFFDPLGWVFSMYMMRWFWPSETTALSFRNSLVNFQNLKLNEWKIQPRNTVTVCITRSWKIGCLRSFSDQINDINHERKSKCINIQTNNLGMTTERSNPIGTF